MLRKVNGTNINMIFVQEERKKDWLAERNGCTLADVLIEEYSGVSNGKIEVCNFEGFLESYAHELGIQEPIIDEFIKKLRLERAVYSGWETIGVTMIYSDLNCEPDEAYEIINRDINFTKIEFDNETESGIYLKDE